MEYGVIMAGGSGTRLWPLSRKDVPKQLLPVVKGKSLLQLSYERLRGLLSAERIYVCTSAAHRDAVLANLPELPPENLLGEPVPRDTANAVGFSAAVLLSKDKDAVMAITTADHVIAPVEAFRKSVRMAFKVVAEDPKALVTFGIVATHGHTGLGYIHRGEALKMRDGSTSAYKVMGFREKPDKPTADRYVESGQYYWNSGMFVWRCDAVLGELKQHLPASYTGLSAIGADWGTDRQDATLATSYPTLPKISIDYAVMEPAAAGKGAAHVVTVEMPIEWLDVGSWPALAETLDIDDHDNAVDCKTCLFVDSADNIIVSQDPEHLVATIGVSDMIIVHTPQITLICPKSEAQRVKDLVGKAKDKYGEKYQ